MSVTGTGVAAGVAQTGLQAQQVAKARDRGSQTSVADAKRVHDLIQVHLRALEEGDQDGNSAAKLRVDDQVPEQQTSRDRSKRRRPPRAKTASPPADQAPVTQPASEETSKDEIKDAAPAPNSPLYRHLDVQA